MPRPSDPNPDGISRFKDFCVHCGNGIRLHSKPCYRLIDGAKHYTCEECKKRKSLDSALDEWSDTIDRTFDKFEKLFTDIFK